MATKQKEPFSLGGLASSAAALCTHPLDLLKVRMQTTRSAAGAAKASASSTAIAIVRHEGLSGLYAGLSGTLRHATPEGGAHS